MKKQKATRHKSYTKDILAILILIMLISTAMFIRPKPKPIVSEHIEQTIGIPYVIDTIPKSEKRPGQYRRIKYIIVHNTANETSNARNERDYLTNHYNTSSTSWHLAVDEYQIIEAIPLNEVAYHAGSQSGNEYGIGIELCESGNYAQTEENAAKLIAYLMKYYKIPISRVMTHQDFSGKHCPRLVLEHWDTFIAQIQAHLS